ncbi:hypothetical protein HMPREF9944_00192 [Segatella maculosa OT 289]|uniref:Uncharacterized protein n=1 Tax=Segatella maculosa OT 289 TaxID=999422 RepID=H1HJ31_9BACT|nr:hypothetical protein HMPREF9944_00192 [Segatella maculosa OT 289]
MAGIDKSGHTVRLPVQDELRIYHTYLFEQTYEP